MLLKGNCKLTSHIAVRSVCQEEHAGKQIFGYNKSSDNQFCYKFSGKSTKIIKLKESIAFVVFVGKMCLDVNPKQISSLMEIKIFSYQTGFFDDVFCIRGKFYVKVFKSSNS